MLFGEFAKHSGIMGVMGNELVDWLTSKIDAQGWSMREVARRAGMSHTTVSLVLSMQQKPTWDFCAGIAKVFDVSEDTLFVMAGLRKPLPPAVEEENEAIAILRSLQVSARHTVMNMLRGLAPGARRLVVDKAQSDFVDPQDREMMAVFQELPEEARPVAIAQVLQLKQIGVEPRIIGGDEEEEGSDRPQEEDQAA